MFTCGVADGALQAFLISEKIDQHFAGINFDVSATTACFQLSETFVLKDNLLQPSFSLH